MKRWDKEVALVLSTCFGRWSFCERQGPGCAPKNLSPGDARPPGADLGTILTGVPSLGSLPVGRHLTFLSTLSLIHCSSLTAFVS